MSSTETERPRTTLGKVGPPLIGAIAVIAIWWGSAVVFEVRTIFLPKPPEIIDRLVTQPDYLFGEAWNTLVAILSGYGIAVLAAVIVAIVLGALPPVERAILPLLITLNAVPKVVIAPLLVFWLGFGSEPKIFMAALICFFPLVVATMSGLASTPAELGELSRSLSASWWQTYLKVRIPWALPQIFVGLKVAMSLAPIGAVVAEVYNPNGGLGAVVAIAIGAADTPKAFAAIVLLAAMSVSLYYIVVAVERLVLPWAREITA
ncbi:ABC transporter permease [Plantactinospora sp. CA-290183]|uniref:ABC transporter permease n=1 Tax=Plantactinospora sp. CA-290183 TaxID=3240006 RepID=UPI003D8C25AE